MDLVLLVVGDKALIKVDRQDSGVYICSVGGKVASLDSVDQLPVITREAPFNSLYFTQESMDREYLATGYLEVFARNLRAGCARCVLALN